jgi:crotonobetainyl-CoA:carnitine CoA-transferase CaiB-like acyl-CoA transferase
MRAQGLVAAPVNPISAVRDLPAIAEVVLTTRKADGSSLRLAPPAVDTPFLSARGRTLPPPPRYGEHTRAVLREIGLSDAAVAALAKDGVVWDAGLALGE